MRTFGGLSLALLMAGSLCAQFRGNPGFSAATPRMTGGFGSVVFPGGTAATSPGIQRNFGSVVSPGGGGPRLVIPGSVIDPSFGLRLGATVAGRDYFGRSDGGRGRRATPVYAYPVYVGGFYDSSYMYPTTPVAAQEPAPQNITIIYPPQQSQAAPVMLYPSDSGNQPAREESNFRMYQAPYNQPAEEPSAANDQPRYLLAFKDHTIYSAVAYWVDGDTLHYFTAGNKHNQASLSLVDRDLTQRLNKEAGVAVNLGPAK